MAEAAANRPSGELQWQLALARQIIDQEARALWQLAKRLDESVCLAAQRIESCRGSLIVMGMGKAGLVGQKIAATFASTGTPSHFVHPAEAVHGDLGRIRAGDVVLALSASGRTEEVLRLLPALDQAQVPLIAMTSQATSPLGQAAEVCLELGDLGEACPLGLAPSTTTTAMLALGDALAFVVSYRRGFRSEDFARLHPGGNLGRRLATVQQVMRPRADCRVALESETVRELLIRLGTPGRRSGAVMVINQQGQLVGIFTDSDLARLLESRADAAIDGPVAAVMTRQPITARSLSRVQLAIELLRRRKISELPVVDDQGCPVGLIDVTDLLDYWPPDALQDAVAEAADGSAACHTPAIVPRLDPSIIPFPNR